MPFDPIWPLYRIILAVAALLVLVLTTYPKRVRHLRPFDRRLLLGLRLATVALLALAMLRPFIHLDTDPEERILYILADCSGSMRTPDGAGTTGSNTRRQELLKMIADSEDVMKLFGDNVKIRFFDFAEGLTKVDELTNRTDGKETNIAAALTELFDKIGPQAIDGERAKTGKTNGGVTASEGSKTAARISKTSTAAIILMSDGTPHVATADPSVDQRKRAFDAARPYGDIGVRIHSVAFGREITSSSAGDLAVEGIRFKTDPYEGKVVTFTANIRARGAKGQRLTARLLVEDRSGVSPPQSGRMVEATPLKTSKPKNNNLIPTGNDVVLRQVELSIVFQRPGKYKIAFHVDGLRDERNTANNTVTAIVNVQRGGISVVYFDRVRTEQKFLRHVSASDKIQLDWFRVNMGGGFGRVTKIDPDLFKSGPGEYDVFIIGDVPARIFGDENLKLLKKRVKEGAGLMMIGGYDSFGPGGYAGTVLDEVLPVEMTKAQYRERISNPASQAYHYDRPLQMMPTPRGLTRFVMRIDPAGKHAQRWKMLAPLEGANKLTKKKTAGNADENLIEVLATTPDGAPLLLSHVWSGARVMAFGADTTYQWYLNGQQEAHQRFWRQIILYLAGEDEGTDRVWVRIEHGGRRTFGVDDKIPIRFGARNEKGKPVPNLNYDIQVTGPPRRDDPKKRIEYRLSVAGGKVDTSRSLRKNPIPGEYWIRVTARNKDPQKTIFGTAWERFIVESTDVEMDNTTPDPKLLKEISDVTGGTFVDKPNDFKDFLTRLAKDFRRSQADPAGTDRVPLWDTWPHLDAKGDSYLPGLLLMFVALMSFEWFLRKRRGLV